MFVSHAKKLVYIRVPKTGSSVVVHAGSRVRPPVDWDLTPYDIGFDTHVMVQDMPTQFKVRYRDYTWMAAIRNPMTWIPSFYSWLLKSNEAYKKNFCGSTEIEGNWHKFLEQLKVTPASWSYDPDGIVTVHSYRAEDPTPMEEILGLSLQERRNRTAKPRDFVPDDIALDLMKKKFFRELPYYEPL